MTSTATAIATAPSAATAAEVERPVRVAVILGSNREGRFGPVIADWVLDRIRRRTGFEVDLIDVAAPELPSTLAYSNPSDETSAALAEITPKLAAADAFVVLTPEYNHSFPAALKSLIDWHFEEWQAKPVGFVSYGGISGGLRAVEQLRQVFAELHAVTVRDTVSFHNAGYLFDEDGKHKDPADAEQAADALLDRLTWWALALRDAKEARPFAA